MTRCLAGGSLICTFRPFSMRPPVLTDMGRNIAGVLVGYVVMVAVVFAGLAGLYAALGSDGAYEAGTFVVTPTWIGSSFVFGIAAAVLGAFACRAIAKSQTALKWLAGLVLVLGLLMAFQKLGIDPPTEVREGEVPFMDAFSKSWQPAWVAFLNPVLGVLGIVVVMGRKKDEPEPADDGPKDAPAEDPADGPAE